MIKKLIRKWFKIEQEECKCIMQTPPPPNDKVAYINYPIQTRRINLVQKVPYLMKSYSDREIEIIDRTSKEELMRKLIKEIEFETEILPDGTKEYLIDIQVISKIK